MNREREYKIQCFPYPNEHSFRVKSPSLFQKESFRRKTLKPGITIIIGRMKDKETTTTQSYRFNKNKYTFEEAKKWLDENNVKTMSQEKATQAFVRLYTEIQALDQSDIIKKIPDSVLENIKKTDKHPFFQMYSVCHEGVSQPKMFDQNNNVEESLPITWTREAIKTIAKAVKSGIKFFLGHNETNDNITQKEVGKVIHAFQEEIKGKLHQLVIGYFPDKNDVIEKDICSQEASWTFIKKAGKLYADTCKKITGIALENSNNAEPAFRGAKRLGFVQAFGSGNEPPGKGENNMTFKEVQQAIKDLNIYPSHIFNEDDLKNDRKFGSMFDKITSLETKNNTLESEMKNMNDEFSKLKRNDNLNTAKTRINKYMKEKALPENIQLFIEKSFEEDKENFDDLSDDGLTKYIDKETKIYQRVMKNLGEEDVTLNNGDGNPPKDEEDYESPEFNEFLEE